MNQEGPLQHPLDPESLRISLPEDPGVYLFKDRSGQVIYVGKAKNLKKRVLSYFKSSGDFPQKTLVMMRRARTLDFILTTTDKEAFILESNLIKKHLPRYNIVLRDDKQYPWLRFDIHDPYPRLSIVRKPKRDGARYFGPFSSANSVRSTLKLINRVFQLRKCKGRGLPKRSRPCLNYQLDRCLGPCSKEIPGDSYREVVRQVSLFLEGRSSELIKELKKNMEAAADDLNFERAARIRDQIRAVERTIERQHVASPKMEDQDIIGLAHKEGIFQLVILFIRKGYLSGSRDYLIREKEASPSEVIEAFLKQYYPEETFIPRRILISEPVEERLSIADWISEIAGKRVYIERPSRGEKLRLLRLAMANARNILETRLEAGIESVVEVAKSALRLERLPERMEGLDISNLHGNMAVGAVVSFVGGLPHKAGYKNYRIKGVPGIDDYAMISELVRRRLSREGPPDLFVIDGGKGHLMAVKRVLDDLGGSETPALVALAKGDEKGHGERVYIPGRKNPLPLKEGHPVPHLLMRIRDEAHRRAITYHRRLRGKGLRASKLDQIPGIGNKRKMSLLQYFGDVESISRAKPEEIAKVPGVGPEVAKQVAAVLGHG